MENLISYYESLESNVKSVNARDVAIANRTIDKAMVAPTMPSMRLDVALFFTAIVCSVAVSIYKFFK